MIPISCIGDDIGGDSSVEPSDCFSFSGVMTGSGGWTSSRRESGRAEVISIVDSWSRDVGRADVGKAGEGGCSNGSGVATIPRDELVRIAFQGRFKLSGFRRKIVVMAVRDEMLTKSRGRK